MSAVKMISLPIDEYQKLDAIRDERDRLYKALEQCANTPPTCGMCRTALEKGGVPPPVNTE